MVYMVYTRRNPSLLIIGIILLVHSYLVSAGYMGGVVKYLNIGRAVGEMTTLGYIFGAIAVIVGLWHWLGTHREGGFDYYSSAIAGGIFILIIAMIVKWYLAPWVAVLSRALGPVAGTAAKPSYLHDVLGLNYVVLGIVAGMITVNVFRIPDWAHNGVRLSRLGLKTGVILLGTLYNLSELAKLGQLSVVMIGFFILGSAWLVLLIGARRKISNSMGGVLAAGVGVCGVSAAVAAAPVVKARSDEIAYTIGTILVFGVICMLLFPSIGHSLGMSYVQFGAWAGTGILNSAQVAGAALAYQPTGDLETLKVGEIFNITRVLFLPIIVLWLAVWYARRETAVGRTVQQANTGRIIIEKFPVFVLGFILMFALASIGLFTPKMIPPFREWLTWLFAFGLTGLGMQITMAAMRQAGGEPLVIGSVVGVLKAVLSLIIVLLFVRGTI
jgi:uncharacterized integral membrane protein (TIGR00698 family)